MRFTRVLYSDNDIIDDISNLINRYRNGTRTFSFVAAEDYFYIGNIGAFNHFFVKLSTPSVVSTGLKVEYFSGSTNTWAEAVETFDETDAFTQSGYVTFTPNINDAWEIADCKYDAAGNVEFSNGRNQHQSGETIVYDKYWVRVSFANDLTPSTVLDWIGQKFCDDDDIRAEYPDLLRSNVLDAFESGKTDWEEQCVKASEILVQDLKKQNVISSKGQILERNTFTLATVSKAAELIFTSFGDDYIDNRTQARNEYQSRLNSSIYDVDLNNDGILSRGEAGARQGFMKR